MIFINFLKENSYSMVKMFINQIGMTIFGLLLAMATVSNHTLLLLASLFSILFYMTLLYTMSWECGAKDKVRVDAGRYKYQPYKGAIMSLIANSINFLLAIFMIIGFLFSDFNAGQPLWAVNLYGVSNAIARFIQAMYLGLVQLIIPNNPIAFFITPLPAIITCGFGYFMGLKNFRILKAFGIKSHDNI